jgi:hypothetical protein
MPRSLGGAIAAIIIGLLLVFWIAGLAVGILADILLWAGVILIVVGLFFGIKALVDGRRGPRTTSRL